MSNYVPDNLDLWERHEEEREREIEHYPECDYCFKKITDTYAFHIDGDWYHKECFESEYYVEVIEE